MTNDSPSRRAAALAMPLALAGAALPATRCEISGKLPPTLDRGEVCARFLAGLGAEETGPVSVRLSFDPVNSISAAVSVLRDGRVHRYPVVAVSESDREVGLDSVEMLARASGDQMRARRAPAE